MTVLGLALGEFGFQQKGIGASNAFITGQAIEDFNETSFATPSPLSEENQLPPAPRLQVVPEEDLAILRAAEEKKLSTYGWVIRTANIVQIPIDRAMQLIANGNVA